jgi:hypothetical protein
MGNSRRGCWLVLLIYILLRKDETAGNSADGMVIRSGEVKMRKPNSTFVHKGRRPLASALVDKSPRLLNANGIP